MAVRSNCHPGTAGISDAVSRDSQVQLNCKVASYPNCRRSIDVARSSDRGSLYFVLNGQETAIAPAPTGRVPRTIGAGKSSALFPRLPQLPGMSVGGAVGSGASPWGCVGMLKRCGPDGTRTGMGNGIVGPGISKLLHFETWFKKEGSQLQGL